MIIEYLIDEDYAVFFLLSFIISSISITQSIKYYGILITAILILILTEISYHIEPRTNKEKKNGRSYVRVIFKKIDSIIDAGLLIGAGLLFHKLFSYLTITMLWESFVQASITLGSLVGITLIGFIYIWLNRLRDRPKTKVVKKKK